MHAGNLTGLPDAPPQRRELCILRFSAPTLPLIALLSLVVSPLAGQDLSARIDALLAAKEVGAEFGPLCEDAVAWIISSQNISQ
jgi:hypothetical protein